MTKKSVRVIFDTNVWISFLIGKKISFIKEYIVDGTISIITTPQLILEIQTVTARPKLKKYFPKKSVEELLGLLNTISESFEVEPHYDICRDPKDNFLFDLIAVSKADYLVTGDKDLLEHNPFMQIQIITPADFEIEMGK